MKRIALFAVSTLFVLACQDLPTIPDDIRPSAEIFDGASDSPGANPDFFFLPPLVRNPAGHPNFEPEEFNPNLSPIVEICELNKEANDCVMVNGEPVVHFRFGANEENPVIVRPRRDFYVAKWDTKGLFDQLYRIKVSVAGVELGHLDVDPVTNRRERRAVDRSEFAAIRIGRTVPIRFRIENGTLCPPGTPLCASGVIRGDEGGTVSVPETGTGVTVPSQGGSFPGGVEEITVTVQPCVEFSSLPIDLPKFGECFEVTTVPALQGPLPVAATVFVCGFSTPFITPSQAELVTLHRRDPQTGEVFALPNAQGLCPEEQARAEGNGVVRLARAIWRAVGGPVASLTGPEPAFAAVRLDRGRGGATPNFSQFQFALPAKVEILEGDNQSAPAGSAVPIAPALLVTDLDGNPVDDARFIVDITMGNGTVVPTGMITGDDGIVRVTSWVLGQTPANALRFTGRGYATMQVNGPRPEFDPFTPVDLGDPNMETAVKLMTGEVIFNATGTRNR